MELFGRGRILDLPKEEVGVDDCLVRAMTNGTKPIT